MKRKRVFMYSGQGSHYLGMGKAFFDSNDVFRTSMLEMDEVIRAQGLESIVDLLYGEGHSPDYKFDDVLYTSPALLMIEYALTRLLEHAGFVPDAVLGSSFGEITAGVVSGVLDLEEALKATVQQMHAFKNNCQPGNMIAVVASPSIYDENPELNQRSELAGVNFKNHFIVSCAKAESENIRQWLIEHELAYQFLDVGIAFHSSMIDPAKRVIEGTCRYTVQAPPEITSVSGHLGETHFSEEEDYYWDIFRQPMKFEKAITTMESGSGAYDYVDLGPSGTLANFVKYIVDQDSESRSYQMMTPFTSQSRPFDLAIQPLATN